MHVTPNFPNYHWGPQGKRLLALGFMINVNLFGQPPSQHTHTHTHSPIGQLGRRYKTGGYELIFLAVQSLCVSYANM